MGLRPLALALAVFLSTLAACSGPGAHEAPTTRPLRFVSYNIRHGEGMDRRLDLARTAEVLRALDADCIALQEVDENTERTGRVDQAALLGEALGMEHAFGAFMDYQGGRYGLAILSRLPIRGAEAIELPEGNEPRVALQVELELPDHTTLHVVDVHFDWVRDDGFRFAQAETLAAHLASLSRYVVLGDFNDQPGSRTIELFERLAREADKPEDNRFTIPADDPDREIDFVFAAPADRWAVDHVEVVDEAVASDHRPVLADLRLR